MKLQYVEQQTQGTIEGFKIAKYVMTKKLGQGAHGVVFLARDTTTNSLFACKKLPRRVFQANPMMKRLLDNEVSIMKQISHPNVLHVYDMYITDNNYYLITDFCDQGDLDQFMNDHGIRYFEEPQAVGFLRQLMNGFVELRRHKILHRDLKLANIFLNKGTLVIGDFGFAKAGVDVVTSQIGTPLTMAPEVLFPERGNARYNSKADLWSIGVIYYQLLFGTFPFWGNNQDQLKQHILANSDKKLTFPRPVSSESRDLLQRLLTFYPKARIDWPDFFSHPIFLKFPESILLPHSKPADRGALEEVDFVDEEAFGKLDLTPIATNAAENPLSENDERESFNLAVSKEVFFRYSHELNKVQFLVFAAHKVSEALKTRAFPDLDLSLLNLGLLLVLKALTNTKIIIETVRARKNIYSLDEEAIEMYFKSPFAGLVLSTAEKNSAALKQHYQLLSKRAERNNLPFKYTALVSSVKVTLADLEGAMEKELRLVDATNLHPRDDQSLQYGRLRSILHFAHNSSRVLTYISAKTGAKMDWGILYFKLETADSKELKAML